MTNTALADQQTKTRDEEGHITRATVFKAFAVIAAVSFLLRIVYAGHLYEDDGLWFTAAEEILRGKALYSEVYFDKPPGLALVYALVFRVFGAHIIAIRLFTIGYSIAVSAVLFLFGAKLYGKRTGLVAAGLFAVFSTTYSTGHMQSLSTDLLMALPYAAGAYLMINSIEHWADRRKRALWLSLSAGVCSGLAFQVNPKGALDLAFFAVVLMTIRGCGRKEKAGLDAALAFAMAVLGFIAASLPVLAYTAKTSALRDYWSYVWDWGIRYGGYYGAGKTAATAFTRTADYLAQNNTLLIGLAVVVCAAIQRRRNDNPGGREAAPGACFKGRVVFRDLVLLIWLAVSYAGLMIGGRFFGHYFIQILPALCLIGARGLTSILASLRPRSAARRVVIALIAVGFLFTLIRFHGRGALLAADLIRGSTSDMSRRWYYNERAREERMIAAVVRELPGGADAAGSLGLEAIRADGPRTRGARGADDYLFVWGYRPEIYYWSGLFPASRFLSTQPLTGVPADVHYFGEGYRALLEPAVTAVARAQLLRDLEATKPKYIIDEIGFFNSELGILQFAELRDFLDQYKPLGATGRFFVYRRKDFSKKYLLRHSEDPR